MVKAQVRDRILLKGVEPYLGNDTVRLEWLPWRVDLVKALTYVSSSVYFWQRQVDREAAPSASADIVLEPGARIDALAVLVHGY